MQISELLKVVAHHVRLAISANSGTLSQVVKDHKNLPVQLDNIAPIQELTLEYQLLQAITKMLLVQRVKSNAQSGSTVPLVVCQFQFLVRNSSFA